MFIFHCPFLERRPSSPPPPPPPPPARVSFYVALSFAVFIFFEAREGEDHLKKTPKFIPFFNLPSRPACTTQHTFL